MEKGLQRVDFLSQQSIDLFEEVVLFFHVDMLARFFDDQIVQISQTCKDSCVLLFDGVDEIVDGGSMHELVDIALCLCGDL